ncbi:MAG: hypothetical protein KatS3mg105_4594 [Gemmatales bacterium]|nr:MAG: hypothetical protein KatS3mg105_4594 [Gemmatales bacterium]
MGSFFYNLGKMIGPHVRKAKWVVRSLTGTEADAVRAEAEVGRDLARAFTQQMELDRSETSEWLKSLGALLAGSAPSEHSFSFELVKTAEVNAFALPGGYIFVTAPLLQLCQGKADEVAFVLAHEMAHVTLRHAIDRLMAESVIRAATSLPMARGIIKPSIVSLAGTLLQQGYSQDQELEADRFGIQLIRQAGFQPAASCWFFQRLQQQLGGNASLLGYFSSHPPLQLRIRQAEKLAGV